MRCDADITARTTLHCSDITARTSLLAMASGIQFESQKMFVHRRRRSGVEELEIEGLASRSEASDSTDVELGCESRVETLFGGNGEAWA